MRLPPRSSTTQPFTKAVCGSLSQTYLFPEKSFSPSMPLTTSRLNSSVLMNEGAKVPELRLLVLLDRFRTCPNLAPLVSWLPKATSRAWPRTEPEDSAGAGVVVGGASGDGKRAEFGLLFCGAGEGDCLMKGLLRTVPMVKTVLVVEDAKRYSSRSYQPQDNKVWDPQTDMRTRL